MERDTEKMKNE